MIEKKRYYKFSEDFIESRKDDFLCNDLYLCEIAHYEIKDSIFFSNREKLKHYLLIYCTKGGCIIQIANDTVSLGKEQFCIIPKGYYYKIQTGSFGPSIFLTCRFDGKKAAVMERDFTVIRDLIPSTNNLVANRIMLFDELFKNLNKGYCNANFNYINFCFGHLLATFIYASKTSDDFNEEQNPAISKAIRFMEQNINRKLTLNDIAEESGYSASYLSYIFSSNTGYSPLSYFSHLKILKACEYLDSTKLKIKEISFELGYTDPYYFSKDFTRKMGLSPRNYRQRISR